MRCKVKNLSVCIILSVSTAMSSAPASKDFQIEMPRWSEEFVNSVGINTHLSYFDTSYGDIALVSRELKLLGVRHVRDGGILQNADYNKRLYAGWKAFSTFGVQFDMVLDPRGSLKKALPGEIQQLLDLSNHAVESIEGPNELDVSGLQDWASIARDYQQHIFSSVAALPSGRQISLVGPSMAFIENGRFVGNLSSLVTYGTLHSYPAGREPAHIFRSQIAFTSEIYPHRPLMLTETGYHNAVRGTNPQPGVSEAAASKYIPRLLLEAFNIGIIRTYLYELQDEFSDPEQTKQEEHWGLLRSNGTEKPAFVCLRNMMNILAAAPAAKGAELAPLIMRLDADPFTHHTLLQDSFGSYYLLLWREVSSYDTGSHQDRDVLPKIATIVFQSACRDLSTYDISIGTEPLSVLRAKTSLSILVPDHVVIVKFDR